MSTREHNTLWARVLVDELVRLGVRHVSMAPGSRSTPLVMAASARSELSMRVHVDERSAGFFALGQGKATGRPTAVITTSGTAAANLLPAVVEAATSDVPLLVLSADRPPHVRGTDSNQAIDQVRLFGTFARLAIDLPMPDSEVAALRHLRSAAARAISAALGEPAGPVHLNVPFEKPLEPTDPMPVEDGGRPDGAPFTAVAPSGREPDPAVVSRIAEVARAASSGVIVAGPGSCREGPEAARAILDVAHALGWPVLADPLSGLRFHDGDHAGSDLVLGGFDLFLRSPLARTRLAAECVIRLGSSPTSTRLGSFLEDRMEASQVAVDAGGRWKDRSTSASLYVAADPGRTCRRVHAAITTAATTTSDRDDAGSPETAVWLEAERAAVERLRTALTDRFCEGTVLHSVAAEIPAGAELFVSNSMPVRDLDAFAPVRGASVRVHGNRGASGIDGIVSTAVGVASVSSGPTVAVVGDLAFLHDLNGLFAARDPDRDPGVVFVVIDNDGGGIFHMLPIREHEPEFTRMFATPHGLDLVPLARGYGVECDRIDPDGANDPVAGIRDRLRQVVDGTREDGRTRVLVVPSDRSRNREVREAIISEVVDAVEVAFTTGSGRIPETV